MDTHKETIFGMGVFLRPVGSGKDKKFQDYFSIQSYRGLFDLMQ